MKATTVDRSALQTLVAVPATGGGVQLEEYVEILLDLTPDRGQVVEPNPEQSLRSLKMNFTKAAKTLAGVNIKYGETEDGKALVVWLI